MAKGLLLGAGFSFDLGMPLASEFSDTLFSFLNSFKIENLINNMRGHRPCLKNTKGINILKIHGGLNELFQGDEKQADIV